MLRVGLSGGIGSGKSTVAQHLANLGAVVIDADQLAREVVATGSEGLAAVVTRFGDEVLDDEGALNRAALGAIVFADEQARRDLEGITHPLIARRTGELLAAAPADAVVVHDVPLLVEKHYGPGYHLVVIVGADEDTRVRRLMQTRGMTEADARSRIAAQASDEQRRAAADVWLQNQSALHELRDVVERLWHERLVPFEANVRHGTRSARSDRLLLTSDPTWPAQAIRVIERLRRAFGDAAITVDHIGSTAIPGLVAKDVLDVQIGVAWLEAADEPELVQRLTEAGFPRVEGGTVDNAKDGQAWVKRFHGSSDPGRMVNVHVREVGSPGWRWALMFRDCLRADPDLREEYAAQKLRIAAGGATVSAYAEAKEPWFDAVHERVEAWASGTGWRPPER